MGDKSRFVKEIEEALLSGEIDLAVHSAKDVPGVLPGRASRSWACRRARTPATRSAARARSTTCRRARRSARARCAAALNCSPPGPTCVVSDLRGNVDTRLRKLSEGSHDAVVLALAGLKRLGRDEGAPLPTCRS